MAEVDDDRAVEDVPSYNYDSTLDLGERDPEHRRALERLQLSAEAYGDQLKREKADLAFQVPELMWSKDARSWREGEVVGNITIPQRPIVSIPKIDQPVQIVLNQERAAHLGVTFHPLDENSNDETAEMQTGLYRTIERLSRAGLARSWGFERAVKCGRGGWRIITVPSETYQTTKDQDIRIQRMLFQESAFPDPFAIEPDWSDGEFLLILEWISFAKYKRLNKTGRRPNEETGELEDFPSVMAGLSDGDLSKLQIDAPAWVKGEGEGRAILTGEYMYMEDRPQDEAEALKAGWRERETRRVCWRRMNPIEFTDRGIIHCRWIPWIPAVGKELIPFDEERRWVGMYGPNKDAQNVFNYAAASAVESMAQEPRNTWIVAEGQEVGHEREFLLANARNFPYIRYKPKALGNELVPPPRREQADTSKLSLAVEMLGMASEWIHAGTSMYEPSLGKSSPNAKTKGGTLALQNQGDQANSHWLDNHVEISMSHEARCIASMMPYYYDRPGRIVRLLGRLGEATQDAKTVMLNHPYTDEGGKLKKLPYTHPAQLATMRPGDRGPVEEQNRQTLGMVQDPAHPAKFFNLLEGIYGTSTSIGKGYKARIDQGADELGQLFQAEPELFKVLGDIYLRFRDFPGHEEAAERVKKLLPPQLQGKDQQDDPKVQLEQAKAAMQAMQQELEALQPEKLKYQAQVQIAGLKEVTARLNRTIDIRLQIMKDATQLEAARIAAKAELDAAINDAELEAEATGREHAFDAHQAELDRQHEATQTAAQQAHDATAAGAAAGQDAAAAAAGAGEDAAGAEAEHGRSIETIGAEHANALEMARESAALEPKTSGDETAGE